MLTRYKNPENDSPCFVIHNVFSNEECKKIISEYKDQVQKATHDDGSGGLTDNDDSVRSSKVSWINNTSWHYDGSGGHFSKRSFTFGVPNSLTETANPGCINTVRKISASVLLNDDYSGGEFDSIHLEDGIAVKKEIKPKTGDAIFFPSHIQHRVRPVRVGTRYSLVCWFAGPPFK